jgi:hypothetical protein
MWVDLSSFPHRRSGFAKTRGENIQANTSGRHFLSFSVLSAIEREGWSLKGSLSSAGRKIRFLKLR